MARFDYRIWAGFSLRIGRGIVWINPGLMLRQMFRRPDFLMFGGMWESFTSLWCVSFAPAKHRIGWVELNVDIPGSQSRFLSAIKHWCLSRCDFIAVPGEKGLAYLRRYAPARAVERAVLLPNIVDESVFARSVGEEERARAVQLLKFSEMPGDCLRLIWPARLIPDKGVVEFLCGIDPNVLKGVQIRIIGDGPLRREVLRVIHDRSLQRSVLLLDGYVDFDLMPAIYQSCDALFLPSLHDPNPLCLIEAMHSSLPVLVSDRLGNRTEAVDNFVNGVAFDPTDFEDVARSINWLCSLPAASRKAAGDHSRRLAQARWGSEASIRRFVDSVLGPMDDRP
jgi:glycosyltransferase involved in cell wall biosynthesis